MGEFPSIMKKKKKGSREDIETTIGICSSTGEYEIPKAQITFQEQRTNTFQADQEGILKHRSKRVHKRMRFFRCEDDPKA